MKRACLAAHLPRLIYAVEILEAAAILVPRQGWPTLLELFLATLRYGRDQVRVQHLHPDYYQKWLRRETRFESASICQPAGKCCPAPAIAIFLMPQSATDLWLAASIESICNQCYPNWTLYLFSPTAAPGNNPPAEKIRSPVSDPRIHLVADQESMSATLAAATGEFVVFPAARDLLSPTALFEVVKLLNQHPEADIIYPDEDAIDVAGKRRNPFFKPAWSPDLALSMPYTGPLTFFRTSLVQAVGGIREEMGPAVHYDLLLRLIAHTAPQNIHHLPKILYHRRTVPGKTGDGNENLLMAASKQALADHLHRTSQAGKVLPGDYPGTYRVIRELPETNGVSIIIPFKDNLPLLSQCLNSIFQKTDYPRFEIVLVNNQSRDQATYAYLDRLADNPRVRRLDFPEPFNFSAMNNRAVEQAAYPYILFLNNDTEVISSDWLRAMLEHLQRDEVGAVGAKLLYPDNTIQHGGLALGGGGMLCGDFFRGIPEDRTAHVLTRVIRNCSAVTGACLLTKKPLFQAVGGFDERNLPICYNDVDLCLKLRQRGYLIVWTPYARLYHHESASRLQTPRLGELERLYREQKYFEDQWWPIIAHDPYFNPNLSRLFDGYAY